MNGKLVIGTELDTKSFDAQIEATRRKLEMLEKSADESNLPKSLRRSADEAAELNKEIEKTRNELVRLQDQQNKLDKSDGMNFKNGLKGLKKFALGLIGIRSLYSLARKASSTWLSQDTELAKKFQNVWLGLGAALQPVLEWLANAMYKLLGYLNEFVKAFTNGKVDLVAKANAIALKKQAESMKELKNQTYGFDELNIQQVDKKDDSSSIGGIKIPELNSNIVKIIGDIGKGLGDISRWVEKNLGVNGIITLGIAGIIGVKLLGGGGTGLLGMVSILILIYETTQLIGAIKDYFEVKEIFANNTEAMKIYNATLDELLQKYKELSGETKLTDKEQQKMENDLKALNSGLAEHSNSLKKTSDSTKIFGISIVNTTDEQKELLKQSQKITSSYENLYKTQGLTTTGALEYINALETQKTIMKNLGQNTSELDKKINNLKNGFSQLDGIKVNPKIQAEWELIDKSGDIYTQIKKKLEPIAKLLPFGTILLNSLNNKQIDTYLKKLGLAHTGGVLNKSALGSIVNNPGRGVYVGGNTIAGEAGKEGIIPLTDPNAMTELGETIGRYITVNLTNITKLDSKTINKENRTISNDMNFIRNGGGA